MKAVLLCAGYATRMYPLTHNFPKSLLSVAGKPILSDLVLQLVATGHINEFIIVTNARFYQHFLDWAEIQKKEHGVLVSVLDDGTFTNEASLGAVGDLELVIQKLNLRESVLISAGDSLYRMSFNHYLNDYTAKPRNLVLIYKEESIDQLRRAGVVEIDGDGRVLKMLEKPENPPSQFACPAMYILQTEALSLVSNYLKESPNSDAPGNFIAWLSQQQAVYTHHMRGRRLDVGNIETYRNAEDWLVRQHNFSE